ncbi:MAG TPA: hypothetical protein VFM55_19220 [Micromonosporaceae bacterium]|nr:hypothetical protein [Micromonosporaceae bacterium]
MKAFNNRPAPEIAVKERPVQMGLDFTGSGIPMDRDDIDHDPLNPDWEVPTPLNLVMRLTRPPICPARHRRHRCQRWDLPAAHTDGVHQAGKSTWPVEDEAPPEPHEALFDLPLGGTQ